MLKLHEKRLIALLVGLVVIAPFMSAQEAKRSEHEAMYQRYAQFASHVKGGLVEPHWMADGAAFWYAEGSPANTVIWKVDAHANTKTPLFDAARLRRALTVVLGHEPPGKGLPFSDFVFLDGEAAVKFTVKDKEFILQLDTYTITQTPTLSEQEKNRLIPQVTRKDPYGYWPDVLEVLSPDRRWFAGVKDYSLWLRSADDARRVPLTTDGVKDYEWHEGYPSTQPKWSPNSLKLAVKKMDFRGTPRIPVVHHLNKTEEVDWVYYPKAGERRALSERSGGESCQRSGSAPRSCKSKLSYSPPGNLRLPSSLPIPKRLGQWEPSARNLRLASTKPFDWKVPDLFNWTARNLRSAASVYRGPNTAIPTISPPIPTSDPVQ